MRPVNREILRLALPSILANITVPLVGMVDIAVAGHLDTGGAAPLIGGIAVGSMLFDLLYWNFGFLRVSTGGMTAQAYGSSNMGECARMLLRSVGTALAGALVLIAIQWMFVKAAFLVVDCSEQVKKLACQYFFVRIWAAPATLSLMAFKGWFIGMQDGVSAMVVDLVVNAVNIAASIILALGIGSWEGFGYTGVALGTVAAQYSGLVASFAIVAVKYWGLLFHKRLGELLQRLFHGDVTHNFFSMNGNIFVRSLCFIAIYIGYTVLSARYGDTLLASCSIMMKLLMIFSYFTDGFAYAAEAMVGKYTGSGNETGLRDTVKWCFVWTAALALLFMFVYGFGGKGLVRMMTSDDVVVCTALKYIPWMLLMPLAGCAAFTWDGVFIGATRSGEIRNAMLWATAAFFGVWFALVWMMDTNEAAIHLLMAAYFAHLFARSLYLTVRYFCRK